MPVAWRRLWLGRAVVRLVGRVWLVGRGRPVDGEASSELRVIACVPLLPLFVALFLDVREQAVYDAVVARAAVWRVVGPVVARVVQV